VRVAKNDEAEQVQTENECQRDHAEQKACWSRTDREADRDCCESENQRRPPRRSEPRSYR